MSPQSGVALRSVTRLMADISNGPQRVGCGPGLSARKKIFDNMADKSTLGMAAGGGSET
jgi:hypothetical protein